MKIANMFCSLVTFIFYNNITFVPKCKYHNPVFNNLTVKGKYTRQTHQPGNGGAFAFPDESLEDNCGRSSSDKHNV